jgi:hypothetical protein
MKTANEKRSQAFRAFFLSPLLLRILVRRSNITAKAHGLILSATAAGSITQKKLILFEREVSEVFSSRLMRISLISVERVSLSVGVSAILTVSCAKIPPKERSATREKESKIFFMFCIQHFKKIKLGGRKCLDLFF